MAQVSTSCAAVSPATRPPCNSANPCDLIQGEIDMIEVPIPEPGPEEVVVRIDATPINPSDLGLLMRGAQAAVQALRNAAGTAHVHTLVEGTRTDAAG